jgi:hypothetical protein
MEVGKLDVRPGAELHESFRLDFRRQAFRVVDAGTGDGVAGASLTVFYDRDGDAPAEPTTADSGGNADLWVSERKHAEVFVEAAGFAWESFRLEEKGHQNSEPVRLALSRVPGLKMEIRCPTSPLLPSMRLRLEGAQGELRLPFRLRPDPSGRLLLAVPAGEYRMRVEAEGFRSADTVLTPDDFRAGEKAVELEPR